MICYKDMTFCEHHANCGGAAKCGRALTDDVKQAAARWWRGPDAPIAVFASKPECHEPL